LARKDDTYLYIDRRLMIKHFTKINKKINEKRKETKKVLDYCPTEDEEQINSKTIHLTSYFVFPQKR